MRTREEVLAFIRKGDWPLQMVLPMKRPHSDCSPPDMAVMILHDETRLYLDINPFAQTIIGDLVEAKKENFKSLDAILDAGWVVD